MPILWDDLEIAVERNAPNTESFLDLEDGHVVTIVAGEPDARLKRQMVSDNIHDYLRVEPASSREQYRWMERFVGSVSDDALRERLLISIDGKGAFRRFKDVLLAYPAERERWFSYRSELLHWHIHNWLEEHKIEPTNEAPWGEAKPPPELPKATDTPLAHITEAPGEALRRQAKELIDSIPAIDLPSAIAFLEFLRERGREALARSDGGVNDGVNDGVNGGVNDGVNDDSSDGSTEGTDAPPGSSDPSPRKPDDRHARKALA